ncbi:21526_t:CDS:1, partial [Cetraspora pellucida]
SEEIPKEEAEMKEIEKGENIEYMDIVYIEIKKQQYEMNSDEEASINLSVVINQMQDLSISKSSDREPIASNFL